MPQEKVSCYRCGSISVESKGWGKSKRGDYEKFFCKLCGKYGRYYPATGRIVKNYEDHKPRVPTTPRTCLKCDSTFESEGPWNRICGPCTVSNGEVMRELGRTATQHHRHCQG